MKSKEEIEFLPREIQLIIESLLHLASPDVNHHLYYEDIKDSVELAIKLRMKYKSIPVDNVFFSKNSPYHGTFTGHIKQVFPEIKSE